MSERDFDIDVHWPDRRVRVRVDVEPEVGPDQDVAEPETFRFPDQPTFPVDDAALTSPQSLTDFLREATRAEADGAKVRAVLREPDLPLMLKLLDHTGPVTQPITVEVN